MNEDTAIQIYESPDHRVHLDVRLEGDTVWVNRQQLAALFGRDVKTIGKHVANALREELVGLSTVAKFATVQSEGDRLVERDIEHYNLDMILSIGYRVKSSAGIHFRRWATTVLRQHLIDGYTVNQHRLDQVGKVLEILGRADDPMVSGVADVLHRFTYGLDLLDAYDHQTLAQPSSSQEASWELTYDQAREIIDSMRFGSESELFGHERDGSFKGIIPGLYQSFGGVDLYPSVAEKAANLLYLVVKDHSFSDGNKRIAAALFIYFLDRNHSLYDAQGQLIISNNTLAAITVMIAVSHPNEKNEMCLLVMNMLLRGVK